LKHSFAVSRFSARIGWFALLALVLAGTAASPLRLAAQQAAPAAGATAAPAREASEDAQTAAFRLEGPLVKATAKALNISPETTARGFEILNFLIVVLALGIPLVKFVPKVLRKRSHTVLENIDTARKVTEDANTRLSAIEAKLAGLDTEIAEIRAQVEEDSKADEGRIKSSLEEESARIVAAAEQEIAVAAAQATRGLRNFAADLAIDQAAKQLAITQETDSALIAEFLADVGKGGQN
jgi:F-type H+-transporting ATPase subunit b